jgi:hypothetical protein
LSSRNVEYVPIATNIGQALRENTLTHGLQKTKPSKQPKSHQKAARLSWKKHGDHEINRPITALPPKKETGRSEDTRRILLFAKNAIFRL